jgi:hypothetical protein
MSEDEKVTEATFRDKVMVRTTIHLSLTDKLLVLFRPFIVETEVSTENEVGRTEARARGYAARWRWPWQRNNGEAEAKPRGPAMPYV